VQNKSKAQSQRMKKCPVCFTYLPIDAEISDKYGFAKKSVDWISYIRALSMWIILGLYLWWTFLKNK